MSQSEDDHQKCYQEKQYAPHGKLVIIICRYVFSKEYHARYRYSRKQPQMLPTFEDNPHKDVFDLMQAQSTVDPRSPRLHATDSTDGDTWILVNRHSGKLR